jgi:hypothetical protein
MVSGGLEALHAREEGKEGGVINLNDERFLTHVPFFLRKAIPQLQQLLAKLVK